MTIKKYQAILKFVYSYPYEGTLLKLVDQKLTKEHSGSGRKKADVVQKIWNKYEKEALKLFGEIYKIDIPEKFIKVYVSLILPNSYSDPMTISLKHHIDIENNSRSKRAVVYTTIHELAHYFAYTRDENQFFNKLFAKIQKIDLLGEHGSNLHYLVQAVEFGIIGEIFGLGYAEYARNWNIENWGESEYGKSAKLLKKHNVPLDRACLEYVNKKILKKD